MTPSEPVWRWESARRTHILSPLVSVVPLIKQSVGLVFLALATGRLGLLAIGAGVAMVGGWLHWWRRTWSFDGEVLIREQGLLERQTRRFPVVRIQQVELVQSILHRMFGLAAVRVEIAGGSSESGVHLDALRRDEAEALRLALLAARAAALSSAAHAGSDDPIGGAGPPVTLDPSLSEPIQPAIPPPPTVEQTILTLDSGRLMLAGITSSTLMVVGALSVAVVDVLGDLPESWSESVEDGAQSFLNSMNWLSGAVLVVLIMGLAASLASVVLHHGLTVVRIDDELRMWRGLIERKDAVLPLARVQAVTIRQNPVQRLLKMGAVQVRSASGKGTQESLTIPLADFGQIASLIEATTLTPMSLEGLTPAPRASLPRRVVRRLAVAAGAAAAVIVVARPPLLLAVSAIAAALAVAVVLGFDAHRNLGFRVDGRHMVVRWGSLLRRTTVVTTNRVQSTRMRASPTQRRVGVVTMVLDLAGVGARPTLIDQAPNRCREVDRQVRDASMESVPV